MTDEQLKEHLKEWVKDYCNNSFLDDDDLEDLPGGVELFIEKGVEYMSNQQGKTSESLGDYSVSFDTNMPESLLKLLRPYRKVRFR